MLEHPSDTVYQCHNLRATQHPSDNMSGMCIFATLEDLEVLFCEGLYAIAVPAWASAAFSTLSSMLALDVDCT